jgi:hypothetical protein
VCGTALPSIFGHAETSGHRILEIHTRRNHRFCENTETRQVFGGITCPRTAKVWRALIEDKGSFALCQKDGSKARRRRE